jgi:hypothetical protein
MVTVASTAEVVSARVVEEVVALLIVEVYAMYKLQKALALELYRLSTKSRYKLS